MAYKRVNWKNLPSTNTPVNADNLNKMDEGIANIENELKKLNQIKRGTLTSDSFAIDTQRLQRTANIVSFYISMTCTKARTKKWEDGWIEFPVGFRPANYNLLTIPIGNQTSAGLVNKNLTIGITPSGMLSGESTFSVGEKIQFSGIFIAGE